MRKWISRILFVVSIILLTISLYFLMGMYLGSERSSKEETCPKEIDRRTGKIGEAFFWR